MNILTKLFATRVRQHGKPVWSRVIANFNILGVDKQARDESRNHHRRGRRSPAEFFSQLVNARPAPGTYPPSRSPHPHSHSRFVVVSQVI